MATCEKRLSIICTHWAVHDRTRSCVVTIYFTWYARGCARVAVIHNARGGRVARVMGARVPTRSCTREYCTGRVEMEEGDEKKDFFELFHFYLFIIG